MPQPPLKRLSSQRLDYCLSREVLRNFLSISQEIHNWQYTVTPGVSVFALLPELADCILYIAFGLVGRGRMLHRNAGIFVL